MKIWIFQIASFLGAFLLFQIQPMSSKSILPLFGGSYLVWGASMVFFQMFLLAGYSWIHFVHRRLGAGRYALVHMGLLVLPAILLVLPAFTNGPIVPTWMPLWARVFLLLAQTIGIPFLVLTMTSPLLQTWLLDTDLPEKDNPYWLYGASNMGSMLGLISYPFLVEPLMALPAQVRTWWWGYAAFLVVMAFCVPVKKNAAVQAPAEAAAKSSATWGRRFCWFMASAAACSLLVSVTNLITFDVASVPLLWVLPLAIYLLSFVITFRAVPSWPLWSKRGLSWALLTGVLLYLMAQMHLSAPAAVAIVLQLGILLVCCINCSGALVMTRPKDPRTLTEFYLVMAVGGLAGSSFVSWIMPSISSSLVEYPLSLCLVGIATAIAYGILGDRENQQTPARVFSRGVGVAVLLVAVSLTFLPWIMDRLMGANVIKRDVIMLVAVALPLSLCFRWVAARVWSMSLLLAVAALCFNWTEDLAMGGERSIRHRNYYGIYKVFDKAGLRYLQHGTTQHGREYIAGEKAGIPLAYFHPTTPAADLLMSNAPRLRRIGMIGLGTGALAAYMRAGQSMVIYELDPDNLAIARDSFTYLRAGKNNGANLGYVFGDGRVSLRNAKEGAFDLIIVDAFNSGSIPVHLLTTDAFREFFRALGPDGILLLHVSNRTLKLEPVVYSNAIEIGAKALEKSNAGNVDPDAEETHWMAVTKSQIVFDVLKSRQGWWDGAAEVVLPRPWSDHYSNILGAMLGR